MSQFVNLYAKYIFRFCLFTFYFMSAVALKCDFFYYYFICAENEMFLAVKWHPEQII